MAKCGICKKLLDQDGDDLSANCGGDWRECMARAGDPDEMFAVIEALIGAAYDVGHDHGMNPFRVEHGLPLERVDEGWGPLAERLWQILRDGAHLPKRSSDIIAGLEK